MLGSLLASVSAGVVPRAGAPYIAIGRKDEIAALLSDLEQIDQGGGSMRFLIGRYGSGKSFLIQLIRGYALERDFITADADLSPERRLYGSGGSGVATYRELMKNLASKASPDGGALPKLIARWIGMMQDELITGGVSPEDPRFDDLMTRKVSDTMRELEFLVGGFDFARVITAYYKAYREDGEVARLRMSACLRWLRGEYATKTEARAELGFPVSVIIDDDNWYDFLKLWASLVRKMGYIPLTFIFFGFGLSGFQLSFHAFKLLILRCLTFFRLFIFFFFENFFRLYFIFSHNYTSLHV